MENQSKRYYLEVIGCQKPERYVVKAHKCHTNHLEGGYIFLDKNDSVLSIYPIQNTIIKSIETIKSENE